MLVRKIFAFLLLLLFASCVVSAQNWSGILDPQRAVDWSNKGVNGGIPTRTTVCASFNPGATAAQINSALASCPSGQVVYLNAGTYNLSAGISITHSGVTLRGAGPDQTFLVFSGDDSCTGYGASACIQGSGAISSSPENIANWTAGYAKGTTSITISSFSKGGISNLHVGDVVQLDQLDDSNTDTGNIWVCTAAGVCSTEGGGGLARSGRTEGQSVVVGSISGSGPWTIGLASPVYMPNYVASKSPQIWWSSSIKNSGIENLSLDHTNAGGYFGTAFINAVDCWAKNIRSMNANRAHIFGMDAARITVRDSYLYGTQNAASQSYGFETDVSSDWLIENNIIQHVSGPINLGQQASGNVAAYNFSINDYYTNNGSPTGWMQASQYHHAGGMDYNLFEGNDGAGFTADAIHGTQQFMTGFRNRWHGWEVGKNAQTVGVHVYAYNRYFNVIGNVLGEPNYHHVYECYATSATSSGCPTEDNVFVMGFAGNETYCNNCGGYGNVNNDVLVRSTLMRWGNYDVVNNASRFVSSEVPSGLSLYANAVPASTALPTSFYLSGKPAWFGSVPFPPIGPDVSGGSGPGGHSYSIPAGVCYSQVMGGPADGSGGVLSFNANKCYSSSGSTPPAPPTGLSAVVH